MEKETMYTSTGMDNGRPLVSNEKKHYLGDVKWVLYQYICDMNKKGYTFRCGNYAYNKISNMQGFDTTYNGYTISCGNGWLDLNGEIIKVHRNEDLNKKQIIISPRSIDDWDVDETISPDDIVLYFA